MQRIRKLIQKEFKQIFRDPPRVAIIFAIPIVQMLVLAFAITTDVFHIKLAVVDHDKSAYSREIIRSFSQTERFDLEYIFDGASETAEQMRAWNIQMALVIPKDFQKEMRKHQRPQIQIIVDGVDANSAGVALGYAQNILTPLGVAFKMENLKARPAIRAHRVSMTDRMWYNLELDSKQYMVPGIVVVLLSIVPMMLAALNIVREKEIGTLEQLLVTPIRKSELLIGKIFPILVLSFAAMTLVLGFAKILFGLPMEGSLLLLALLSFIYLFTTIGLGVFASTATQTQQQAMFLSFFFLIFMILMSGFFIPIENMPGILQKITYLNPMRYFMSIIRDLLQKGSSFKHLAVDIIPMTIYGIVIFTFAVVKFQKRAG